ncbi:hypothetical protein KXV85_000961 [Aspergillus fumigatus]|nr:hypothetical protein KXV85_000961 [Aspergillus fumigatus]
MRIGELARASGVSRAALRLYEKRGLLCATRSVNGYREYPASAVQRIDQIKTAQLLGFSLTEIARQLSAISSAADPNAHISALFHEKAAEMHGRIIELARIRNSLLSRALHACPLHRRLEERRKALP